jgi:hypothetical protein
MKLKLVLFLSLVFTILFSFFLFPESIKAQFEGDLGDISGTLTWGAENAGTNAVFRVYVTGNTTGFSKTINYPRVTNYSTGFILPEDIYTVTLSILSDNSVETVVGTQTVTVTGGQTTTTDFDLSTSFGIVQGTLMVNGVPASGKVQFCDPSPTAPCPNFPHYPPENYGQFYTFNEFGSTSGFRVPLPPGDYRVHVMTYDGIDAGIVPVTVTTGQIIGGSSLQFEINLGDISGTLTWGAENAGTNAVFRVYVTGNTTGFSKTINYPRVTNYSTGFILPEDIYTVTLSILSDNSVETVVGTQTVTVTGGQTTTTDFDLSTSFGIVQGTLMVNGVPASGKVQFCDPSPTAPCPNFPHYPPENYGQFYTFNEFGSTSGFRVPLPPGDYRVHVMTYDGVDMGILPVTLMVGAEINLATNSVSVPTGQDVTVPLAGVEVTFQDVTISGFMSIITTSNPQGGQPPSQYRFLGDYYELTTTAAYAGPITVSFSYNDADVHGQESNLKLFHWDGSAWHNITTSVDTVNNIITGVTPTLSPFAIGDLLNSPPSVDALTIDQTSPQIINTTINASANFSDAGDLNPHTATWNWGDGNSTNGVVTESNGSGSVTGSHTYTRAGVYTLTLTVTDNNGASTTKEYKYIVIYDPSAGFVTGGGQVSSSLFGISAKYTPNSQTPVGKVGYTFSNGSMVLASTQIDWLVVNGNMAILTGSGTINGTGNYYFLVSVIDGSPDKLRIRISDTLGNLIYDNQPGDPETVAPTTAITAGQIKIH